MSSKYGSISNAIRNIIRMKPFIHPCLEEGIVNYSKLSKKLLEDIRRLTSSDVNVGAVKMALIRYSRELKDRRGFISALNVLSRSSLQLINDVILFTLEMGQLRSIIGLIQEVFDKRGFIQITQGRNTVTIVLERRFHSLFENEVKGHLIYEVDNQSAILIVSPEEIMSTPGIIYVITSLLYSSNINITQVISSYLDTVIVVDRSKGSDAFNLLDSLVRWYNTENMR